MFRCKLLILTFIALALLPLGLHAQDKTPSPSTDTTETVLDDPDSLKVFVNEVRIPITAYDENGHFDPTVEADDIMVKENGVLRQLKSIYRIPASVLLLLDTGGELNPAKNVSLTREIAVKLVSSLKNEDRVNVIQVNNRVESIQDWTAEKSLVIRSLNDRLMSGKRTVLALGIAEAVKQLEKTPVGNRHLILISDGIDSRSDRAEFDQVLKGLIESNITTHVISYTSLGLAAKNPSLSRPRLKSATPEEVIVALPRMHMPNDPTPDLRDILERKGGTVLDLERLFRRDKGVKRDLKRREKELGSLAEETGGGLWLPVSAEEMIRQAANVAREVDSQYVITYALQHPIEARAGEYLKIHVISRRVGLWIRARHGYLAKPVDAPPPDNPPGQAPR